MGRGVAYSTTESVHLLNVPAERMSAIAGEPNHFSDRYEAAGGNRTGFAERRFFAGYLGDVLGEAVSAGCTELVEAMAVSSRRNGKGWQIGLDDDSSVDADALVLAIGNQEPDALEAFADAGARFIQNPWGADARAAVQDLASNGGAALMVGTGLTMVDLALSLDAAGYKGRMVALSRRGLAPRAHAEAEPAPVERDEIPMGSVRGLWRWLRRRSASVGWRAAVDSLRPHSHSIWQSLSLDQQRRFLRHARPWWDVHRHRIAPEVGDAIARMIAEDRLQIVAGKILAARETSEGLEVQFRRRRAFEVQSRTFTYVFNCTGPLHSMERTRNPLVRSLLDAVEVRPDRLGIGLEVDAANRVGERTWAMGPLSKGRYWEIIAVPDIREQAAAVADDIQRELGR
jgi:uncharacterized NAD(P)/FAD-binding protein YdhS